MRYHNREAGMTAGSKRLYSRQEVARICGVSPSLVGKWVRSGRLKAGILYLLFLTMEMSSWKFAWTAGQR